MAKHDREKRDVVGRGLHAFKRGDLGPRAGQPVSDLRQAVAIALQEAGAAWDEPPVALHRNPARADARNARSRHRADPDVGTGKRPSSPAGSTRTALHAEAVHCGIAGRLRMSKTQLSEALGL